MTVGIRELKARLSEYLEHVTGGTPVTITDRGRPIATITAIPRSPQLDWAYAMAKNGRASWSGGKPAGMSRPISSRGKLASRMVIEDRG